VLYSCALPIRRQHKISDRDYRGRQSTFYYAATDSQAPSYDLSVQIGNRIYVVLYTPRLGLQTAKYAAGRQVLVLVGEETLTFNDISGNAVEAAILTHRIVAATRTR
jgi:hypothetical protein